MADIDRSVEEIMDPYEWLPGYGESSVELRTIGSSLVVDIEYEEPSNRGDSLWRSLVFRRAVHFEKSGFPAPLRSAHSGHVEQAAEGASRTSHNHDIPVSNLVVLKRSGLADSWSRQLQLDEKSRLCHFRIVFMAENVVLEVIAQSFELHEPRTEREFLVTF